MNGRLQLRSHVRSIIDDGGALLLDLRAGRYFSLNGLGAEICRAAEQGSTLDDIRTDLQTRFSHTPPERVAADLEVFVRTMTEKGLVDVQP